MSAFIVCKRHIDAMVSAGLALPGRYGPLRWMAPAPAIPETHQRGEPWGPAALEEYNKRRRELTADTAGMVGAMLCAENAASVNHRYDEDDVEEPYLFERYTGAPALTPVVVLKAIACYEYQTCEHPEWESSEARAFCHSLRKAMIDQLPGYDAAPWEIREPEPAKPEPAAVVLTGTRGAKLIEGSDLVTAAKNIRAELAVAFPRVRFSVRSSRFSGGNSIDIAWTDGPTVKAVEAITDKYQDGDFDGMDDSYRDRGGVYRAWTEKHGGARFVHCRRDFSDIFVARGIAAMTERYGAHNRPPTVAEYQSGNAYNRSPIVGGSLHVDSWQSLVSRWCGENPA